MEIAEVQAAISTRMKNTTPITWPKPTLPNASGRVTNISPGPSPGFSPAENTMGNRATPASSETKVSISATAMTVAPMEVCFGM